MLVIFLFSCSEINSSTEQTQANLPSAKSARVLCTGSRVTYPSVCSFSMNEMSSFTLLIGRTIPFFHGEFFFVRAPDWLGVELVQILLTMIFVVKTQYL